MKSPKKLFHIEIEHLKDHKIFPFHIYIYNPKAINYTLYLPANSPLDEEKISFIHFINTKDGSLAIDMKQKKTFLSHMEIKEKDIPSLQPRELTDLEKKRLVKIKELKVKTMIERGELPDDFKAEDLDDSIVTDLKKYDLRDGIKNCLQFDNFLPMILAAKEEIELFEVTTSKTVSNARELSAKLLTEDNFTNRVVSVSYFFAKNMDMNDSQTLSDLICAAFFTHLGYTQIEHRLSHKPEQEYTDKEMNKIKKHPGYSHHLLLKSGIEISDRCKSIVFQHHERYSGKGYPSQKHGEFIDQLALILGAISHLFEFSTGRVNGNTLALETVINRIKNKTFSAGLEFDFGDKIYENLIYIVSSENKEDVA